MKIGFIIPMLDDYDIELAYKNIDKACKDSKVDYEIIFAVDHKLGLMFTKIRNTFVENNKIKSFMTDRHTNEHKLITLAMQHCEKYDAIVIYSGKEETNVDVIKAFITSWQAGNKIVYLRKVYRGFSRFTNFFKTMFYKMGIAMLGIFKDFGAENDIQLLDNDVVRTINQLPNKNQLLRTLDSLIYENTDIIHLEVDPNEFINPEYMEKDKDYKRYMLLSVIFINLAFALSLTSILLLSLSVSINFLYHLSMWAGFAISMFLFILFSTKKTLSLRVGKEIDVNELKNINNKIEYYNF